MMETATPELHDAILLCVGVAAVYLVVAVLQLMQLKRHRPATIVAREPSVGSQLPLNAEAFLKRLNLEVERLRTELQATQHEVKLLRSERGTPSVAPLYNEAMSFARRGLNAVGIASQCGISMGEAELVTALARDTKDYGLAKDELVQSPTVSERHEQQHDRYRAAA